MKDVLYLKNFTYLLVSYKSEGFALWRALFFKLTEFAKGQTFRCENSEVSSAIISWRSVLLWRPQIITIRIPKDRGVLIVLSHCYFMSEKMLAWSSVYSAEMRVLSPFVFFRIAFKHLSLSNFSDSGTLYVILNAEALILGTCGAFKLLVLTCCYLSILVAGRRS